MTSLVSVRVKIKFPSLLLKTSVQKFDGVDNNKNFDTFLGDQVSRIPTTVETTLWTNTEVVPSYGHIGGHAIPSDTETDHSHVGDHVYVSTDRHLCITLRPIPTRVHSRPEHARKNGLTRNHRHRGRMGKGLRVRVSVDGWIKVHLRTTRGVYSVSVLS